MAKVVICNEVVVKDGKLLRRYSTANTMEKSKVVKDGVKNADGRKAKTP